MSKIVPVPGIGNVEFPDTMSDDQIHIAVIKELQSRRSTEYSGAANTPTYLDANGNPVQSSYLDANGNPIGAKQPEPKPQEATFGGFASNVASSAGNLVSNVGKAVMHPANTFNAVNNAAQGALSKITPDAVKSSWTQPAQEKAGHDEAAFGAVTKMLGDRYGGWANIKKTAYEDPIGFLLDASSALSGGASVAGKAGLSTAAKVLDTASAVTNPVKIAAKVASPLIKAGGATAAAILGKTTGVGSETIKTAAEGGEAFQSALRGATDHESAANDVLQAAQDVADNRRATYQQQLSQLPSAQAIPVKPIYNSFANGLKRLGVKAIPPASAGADWTLDFSKSPLRNDPVQIQNVQNAFDTIKDWGSKQTRNAVELDTLKQQLGNLEQKGTRSSAIITATKNMTRQILESAVPGYSKMTSDYAEASNFLDQIRSEFSTEGSTGTRVRKMAGALNQRNNYRADLIDDIDKATGSDVRGTVAGADMSSWAPRGIMGPIAAEGAILHPAVIKALGTTSPRLVGEVLLAMSKAKSNWLTQQLLDAAKNPAAVRAASAAGASQ